MKYIHFVLASIFVASTLAAPTTVHRSSLQARGSDEVYERRRPPCSDLQLLQARAGDKAEDRDKAGDKAGNKGVPSRKSVPDLVRGLVRQISRPKLKDKDSHSKETPPLPPVPPQPAAKESTKAGESQAPGQFSKASPTGSAGSGNKAQRPGGSQAPGPSGKASSTGSSNNRAQGPVGSQAPGPSGKASPTPSVSSSDRAQRPKRSKRPASARSAELRIDTTWPNSPYNLTPQVGLSPALPTSSSPPKSSPPISSPPPDPGRRPSEQLLLPGATEEERRRKNVMHTEKTLTTGLGHGGLI